MMELLVSNLPEKLLSDIARGNAELKQLRRRVRELERMYAVVRKENQRLRSENDGWQRRVRDLEVEETSCQHHIGVLMTKNQALLEEVTDLRLKRGVYDRELARLAKNAGATVPTSTDVPPGIKVCRRCGHAELMRFVRCPECSRTGEWWK